MTTEPITPEQWNPPHAVVTQVGRWKYGIYISHGLLRYENEFGGPYRYGRRRAEKKAERMLAKYLLQKQRRSNVSTLHPDSGWS